jgi:hypothetical protein
VKNLIRNAFPRPAAYLAHLKALFQNEVELRLLPWLRDPGEVAIDVGPSPEAQLEMLFRVLPGNKEIRAHARACAARWPWAQFREGLCTALNLATAASAGHSGIGSKGLSSRAPDELAR